MTQRLDRTPYGGRSARLAGQLVAPSGGRGKGEPPLTLYDASKGCFVSALVEEARWPDGRRKSTGNAFDWKSLRRGA